MAQRSSSTDLPLHGGRVPAWLAYAALCAGSTRLRRLSHPFLFQSFVVLAFSAINTRRHVTPTIIFGSAEAHSWGGYRRGHRRVEINGCQYVRQRSTDVRNGRSGHLPHSEPIHLQES